MAINLPIEKWLKQHQKINLTMNTKMKLFRKMKFTCGPTQFESYKFSNKTVFFHEIAKQTRKKIFDKFQLLKRNEIVNALLKNIHFFFTQLFQLYIFYCFEFCNKKINTIFYAFEIHFRWLATTPKKQQDILILVSSCDIQILNEFLLQHTI